MTETADVMRNVYVAETLNHKNVCINKLNIYTGQSQQITIVEWICGYYCGKIYYFSKHVLYALDCSTGKSEKIREKQYDYIIMYDNLLFIAEGLLLDLKSGKSIEDKNIDIDYGGYYTVFKNSHLMLYKNGDLVSQTRNNGGMGTVSISYSITDDAILISNYGELIVCDHKFNSIWSIEEEYDDERFTDAALLDRDRILVYTDSLEVKLYHSNKSIVNYGSSEGFYINRSLGTVMIKRYETNYFDIYDMKFNKILTSTGWYPPYSNILSYRKNNQLRMIDRVGRNIKLGMSETELEFYVYETDEINKECGGVMAMRINGASGLNIYLARLIVTYL